MHHRHLIIALASMCLALPSVAAAFATVSSVTPLDGGCVAGPSGSTVQQWDVEPGKTYLVTLTGVAECANGGTDATLNVRVNGINQNEPKNSDFVATLVAPGTYQFQVTLPLDASCTMPIFYCTTPGQANTGILVRSSVDDKFGVHLRASTFGAGCTNPVEIQGPGCQIVPVRPSTWAKVKSFYR